MVVLTVPEVKGLEFDSVVVADPGGIISESERGLSDLYVALTRSTQRLAVVHTGELPVVLRGSASPPRTPPKRGPRPRIRAAIIESRLKRPTEHLRGQT